jgi:uncharacterized BrkB/YihY/UPF0761 family membrane protein
VDLWAQEPKKTYSVVYGSLAVVIILMPALLAGKRILIGGELNAIIEHASTRAGGPWKRKHPGKKFQIKALKTIRQEHNHRRLLK